jgi:predicted phage baseplate assembly protein
MPLIVPRLDDRRYQDLVEDLVRRIPAHTPEWTNPREGDPGRTLLELFAWLADTILYRANLIPERQRLAFLSLLGMPLRPAQPAKGMIALSIEDAVAPQLRPLAEAGGPVNFETLGEVTVFPCAGECY